MYQRYGLHVQVEKDLSILVDLLQQQQQPSWLQPQPMCILVFIDDLDCCRPSKMVEVLEAINQVLGPSGFMVVVSMVSSCAAQLGKHVLCCRDHED
jgi:hypothetical protein